jgi:hypothetical protein
MIIVCWVFFVVQWTKWSYMGMFRGRWWQVQPCQGFSEGNGENCWWLWECNQKNEWKPLSHNALLINSLNT